MAESSISFQQKAYEYVKEKITLRHYRPSEYIMDSQIADELNISRTPVREAFHRLESEKLLIYETRRGWKVYALSLEDINEIFDLKTEIEGMIVRKAATCDDRKLRKLLEDAFQEMVKKAEEGDIAGWIKSDNRLHDLFFEMADNNRAKSIVDNLNDQWNRVRIGFSTIEGRISRSNAEHELIVKSVLSGDGESAERYLRAHLNLLRQELVNVLVNMVFPFTDEGV